MSMFQTPVPPQKVTPPPPAPVISGGEKPRKPQLVAQWQTVNGKLECRWLIAMPLPMDHISPSADTPQPIEINHHTGGTP